MICDGMLLLLEVVVVIVVVVTTRKGDRMLAVLSKRRFLT